MSWLDDRNVERDDRRRYEADAFYEAWRRGVNTDRMNYDRVEQDYYDGREPEAEAMRLQRADYERRCQREQEEIEQAQREYYESLEVDYELNDDNQLKGSN